MGYQYRLDDLRQRKDPFLVPEGYFENFTERMMQALPEAEPKVEPRKKKVSSMQLALRWVLVVGTAALLAIAVVHKHYQHAEPYSRQLDPVGQVVQTVSEEMVYPYKADDAYEYLMLNNEKIYEYEMEEYE